MKLRLESLTPLWEQLALAAPRALLVLFVLIAGLVGASLCRRVVRWLVRRSGLEALAESAGVSKILYAVGAKKGLAELLGRVAWIAGALLTLAAVADLLALPAVSAVVALAVRYLPSLLAASAILLGGMAVAALVRNLVANFGERHDELESPTFVSRVAYYVIITITVTLAADQAGLQTGVVESLILLLIGVAGTGFALSFALGARNVFRNMTTKHYYERLIQPGDSVRIGDVEGVVIRFSPVAIVVRTAHAEETLVPCEELLTSHVRVRPLTTGSSADTERETPVP